VDTGLEKGGAKEVSLPRGLPAAVIFLFIAIVGFVAVVAVGTERMPQSGNELQSDQAGSPPSTD
jgi:hypothetical protein